ncbi:uncharacterized protein LOC134540205 isoform X1 [Bacillus rossius redtenbacheri]|uniref:uncharacterized protein LOC134540205 isoform X1 n=1 Tax=Bacillus rossius redtenbacheri TaxID=93214 RepID=UPI002FDD9A5D
MVEASLCRRYVLAHPGVVRGARVLDVGSRVGRVPSRPCCLERAVPPPTTSTQWLLNARLDVVTADLVGGDLGAGARDCVLYDEESARAPLVGDPGPLRPPRGVRPPGGRALRKQRLPERACLAARRLTGQHLRISLNVSFQAGSFQGSSQSCARNVPAQPQECESCMHQVPRWLWSRLYYGKMQKDQN